jgi:hypothetical protein
LLLPLLAAADSQLQTAAAHAGARTTATAHVSFKIVIPQVLSLRLDSAAAPAAGAPVMAIESNGRTVALGASLRSTDPARGNLILSAPARSTIAEDAACRLLPAHAGGDLVPGARRDTPLVCTASMP